MSETIEPGKWYFHVICRSCQRGIAVMEDPSCGTEPQEATQSARLCCPHCKSEAVYEPTEVQTGSGNYLQ